MRIRFVQQLEGGIVIIQDVTQVDADFAVIDETMLKAQQEETRRQTQTNQEQANQQAEKQTQETEAKKKQIQADIATLEALIRERIQAGLFDSVLGGYQTALAQKKKELDQLSEESEQQNSFIQEKAQLFQKLEAALQGSLAGDLVEARRILGQLENRRDLNAAEMDQLNAARQRITMIEELITQLAELQTVLRQVNLDRAQQILNELEAHRTDLHETQLRQVDTHGHARGYLLFKPVCRDLLMNLENILIFVRHY